MSLPLIIHYLLVVTILFSCIDSLQRYSVQYEIRRSFIQSWTIWFMNQLTIANIQSIHRERKISVDECSLICRGQHEFSKFDWGSDSLRNEKYRTILSFTFVWDEDKKRFWWPIFNNYGQDYMETNLWRNRWMIAFYLNFWTKFTLLIKRTFFLSSSSESSLIHIIHT